MRTKKPLDARARAIKTIRDWCYRQQKAGKPYTEVDVLARIQKNWPTMLAADQRSVLYGYGTIRPHRSDARETLPHGASPKT